MRVYVVYVVLYNVPNSIIEKHQHILNQIVHNTKPINTRIPYHLFSALKSLQHNQYIIILSSDKKYGSMCSR